MTLKAVEQRLYLTTMEFTTMTSSVRLVKTLLFTIRKQQRHQMRDV